jgi:bifunctional non-homologous end joining protein LigD
MDQVLKSWAVPKGVPLKKGAMASAFGTEDHPIDYLQFEGTIPEGQYGSGTVMVWDLGTYEILEGNYWKGRLSVYLAGKKLKGEWTLEKRGAENGKAKWLLIKTTGDARRIAAKQMDLSALSGKTLEQITRAKSAVWQSNRSAVAAHQELLPPAKGTPGKRITTVRSPMHKARVEEKAKSTVHTPQFIRPMKALLTNKLPSGSAWLYEVKWDGYRALAAKQGDTVRLLSPKNKNLNSGFPRIVEAVRGVAADTALLDGEIVAVNSAGQPSFQALQNRASLGRDWHIVYYAFDLLNLEGEDLTRLPLEQRKRRLKAIIDESGVRYSAELPGSPEAIVEAIKKAGLEGVIAKQRHSAYRAASRVTTWLKLKLENSQEFVIGGYNPAGKTFQSVLVGYYEGGHLIFGGKVRQGFNAASRASLFKTMQPLITRECPFANLPSSRKNHFGEGVTAEDMKKLVWVEPKLVAQCSFAEWTSYGLLRHATFLGLREDKDPREVTKERSSDA